MTLVVGYAALKGDVAPLQLAATLARSAGQDLLVVTMVPAPWPTPTARAADREFEAWAQEQGQQTAAAAQQVLAEFCSDIPARAVAVPGKSEAATLIDQAIEVDASMIVVGSGHDGAWGSVVLSSTADRLLHSSSIPVAVATRGFRAPEDARVTRATCAFRGDEASIAVLTRTAAICAEVGAALRVVTFGVRGKTMYPPEVIGEDDILAAYVQDTGALQDRAVADLGALRPSDVETTVATGRNWSEALDSLDWDRGDVLVVGSSPASLMQRLFLGSTATKIVRSSPVPVIVVP